MRSRQRALFVGAGGFVICIAVGIWLAARPFGPESNQRLTRRVENVAQNWDYASDGRIADLASKLIERLPERRWGHEWTAFIEKAWDRGALTDDQLRAYLGPCVEVTFVSETRRGQEPVGIFILQVPFSDVLSSKSPSFPTKTRVVLEIAVSSVWINSHRFENIDSGHSNGAVLGVVEDVPERIQHVSISWTGVARDSRNEGLVVPLNHEAAGDAATDRTIFLTY
jgi:hypothetical protein